MEIIAYNINLDLKTLIKLSDDNIKGKISKKRQIFENNKKKLLPFVFKYVHYMVELNNSIQFNSGGYNDTRILSLKGNILDINEQLESAANDCYFSDDGAKWNSSIFAPLWNSNVSIWLNSRFGCHIATPNLKYSMLGYGKDVYALNIEDYIKKVINQISIYKN